MKVLLRTMALLALATAAYCQTVTAEAKVRIDGRVQTVRKINGRWWSPDNRQMTPDKGGFIWWIGSERNKAYTFHHHRPVKLPLAESLQLFMSPTVVKDLLGDPNETTGNDERSKLWRYYAENGTALFVRFVKDELIEARYERPEYGVSGKQVQSIARELNGRDIFKILADRAWQQRSPTEYAKFNGQNPTAPTARSRTVTISDGPTSAQPSAPKKRIASDLADSVKVGMTRSDVVQILGEPSGGMHISGGESDSETMTYALDAGGAVSFEVEKGKVARISR